jgi:hypothetical protein
MNPTIAAAIVAGGWTAVAAIAGFGAAIRTTTALLRERGLIITIVGRGTYVAEHPGKPEHGQQSPSSELRLAA